MLTRTITSRLSLPFWVASATDTARVAADDDADCSGGFANAMVTGDGSSVP